MTDILADFFKMAVDHFLDALIITLIIACFGTVSVIQYASSVQEQTNTALAEKAEFNQYEDETVIRGSDVIGAVMEYRDTIQIIVIDNIGNLRVDTYSLSSTDYTLTVLSKKIRQDKVYDAELVIGANEEVCGIKFTQQTGGD